MLALSVPVAAPSGFTFVQKGVLRGQGGGAYLTSAPFDTTGADLITLLCSNHYYYPSLSQFPDSFGNTYVMVAATGGGGYPWIGVLYACASTGAFAVGAGHTFQYQNCFNGSILMTAWKGSAASPYDQGNTALVDAAITSINTGSITPTANGALIIAGAMQDNGAGPTFTTVNSGFSIDSNTGAGDGQCMPTIQAHLIQATAAAVNPNFVIGGTSSAGANVACIASFKHA